MENIHRKLDILYQDENLVLINKPSGLLVHKTKLNKSEKTSAMQLLRNQIGQWVYPIHRLDKGTSGVLLFGLSKDAARELAFLFERKEVEKQYLAVVRGFADDGGIIDYPLKKLWDKMTEPLAEKDQQPQEAITEYQKIEQVELDFPVGRYQTARYSLVSLCPKTGRTRQLRRHLSHINHPIVGDTTHGDHTHNKFFRTQFDSHRLLLHATRIKFKNPFSNELLDICASPPIEFVTICNKIGFNKIDKACQKL